MLRLSLALGMLAAAVTTASAANIKLLTTGAYRPVVQDILPNFEKQSGHKVTVVSDTAGALIRRLRSGEAFDVIVLTSDGLDALADIGTVSADSITPLARVGIGVAVPLSAPQPNLYSVEAFRQTLLGARRIAYMDPNTGSTSGNAIVAIFQTMGISSEVAKKTVLVRMGPAADAVARGDADIALQQASEIKLVPSVRFAGLIPAQVQVYTTYTGAISAATQQQDAATALLSALSDPGNEAILKRRGLEAP
ncbi:substrate-binding domain-containing protein [Enhydrobacter aerosaccus]|uniref:substrate-binding domain-containing protein n=1 Tax=Enhydrobacter aerosaccus TaxID=225324 RepID=UPI001481E083|nr:substrate-binding domain-containing protein [Enhydrobacter aerosaccus]